MTEKLYYKDAYVDEFSATVLSCEQAEGGFLVTLDKTAFFPEEGGQYSDTGVIAGVGVLHVYERDGVVYHLCDAPIRVGAYVSCAVLFAERYEKMQCHTAEHILSGYFHRLYGLDNVGFHLGAEDVTMDISAPLSWDELMKVERLANGVVHKRVEVCATFPSKDELASLEYRSKLDLTDEVRIVKIGVYDTCACCAPHVKNTAEIGIIKILDAEKLRGGMRIHIAAGARAYRILSSLYEEVKEVSRSLSVPRGEIASGVRRLLAENEARKAEIKTAWSTYYEMTGELVEECEGNLVLTFAGATQEQLRSVANKAIPKVGGILVLLSGEDGAYKFVMASSTVNLREQIKKITADLGGGGGGSPSMVQGSLSATKEEIEKYFIQLRN